MKKNDKKIFEQAFNELNEEGYFEDFTARANRLPSAANTKAKTDLIFAAEQKTGHAKEQLAASK